MHLFFSLWIHDVFAVANGTLGPIEVLATELPVHHGAQLDVDITMRCARTSPSQACPNAATENRAVLVKARADKEPKYAELAMGPPPSVVVGVETGGR